MLIVDDENKIEIRTVDVIRADGQFAYLGGGVSPGERITTTAIEAPSNGMSVRTLVNVAKSANEAAATVVSSADKD